MIDVLVLLAAAAVLFVGATDGAAVDLGGVRASLTSTGNPLAFGAVLLSVRYLRFGDIPFLWFTRLRPADFDVFAERMRTMLSAGAPAA